MTESPGKKPRAISLVEASSGRQWTTERAPDLEQSTAVELDGPEGKFILYVERAALEPEHPFQRLTSRQREVVELAVRGRTTKEIAEALGIGFETVRSHIKQAYEVLGVASRAELARMAVGDLV